MNPHTLTVAACDLDDTLLQSNGTVSPRTEAAITRWLESGRRFVIATGRPPRTIGEKLPPVLQQVPWICYNGAEIRQEGAVLFREFIPEGALPPLIDRLLTNFPDATVGIELDDLLWLNRPRQQPSAYNRHHRVADLRTVAHRSSAKLLIFAEELDAVTAACEPLPPGTRLMLSGRYHFLQLMSTDADKVHALSHLLGQWGESLECVVAFGDDINDVDLLRCAGLGVAVSNAWPPAREAADLVTDSNDEDGVAAVLERLLDGKAP
jgi:Cof subfamily protein (haloacid dehalogenase superfamily)